MLRLALVRPGWPGCGCAGLAAGMVKCRAGTVAVPPGRLRVPVTRVFSLYVVQPGSACPRRGGLACSYSVQPSW